LIVPYVWWHSTVDHRAHAFMTNQAVDSERTHYEAACTLSMPTDAVVRWREGAPCTACLLTIGSALPRPNAAPNDAVAGVPGDSANQDVPVQSSSVRDHARRLRTRTLTSHTALATAPGTAGLPAQRP
jgi:hypothetical protein